ADLAEQLARLVGVTWQATAVGAADERAGGEVDARERHLVLEHGVRLPDRAGAVVEVLERDVALGGTVHLDDAVDAEALLERGPDVRPQAGPRGDTQSMVAIVRRRRLAEQIAAELAHVDECHRLVTA